jgi:hypothetical protein
MSNMGVGISNEDDASSFMRSPEVAAVQHQYGN